MKLESYLLKHGLMMKFLVNYKNIRSLPETNIDTSFTWDMTEEGQNFWETHNRMSDYASMSHQRVLELKKMHNLFPPRYKEVA